MSVHEDRRDAKSQRIPFEAIVEIGGEVDPNAAFEAQGVDLSATGMHLRTAYLPDIGQPLLCRFGSGAQEISAEADVVWRREGARGGEFGIRFTNLDGPSSATLWDMCGVPRGESLDSVDHPAKLEASTGTRVRLHIDGLGSPMKARVRGSNEGELLVGSNLEFLRVGRTLELEDVDRGGKRPAHIDRVDVEIDRTSRVPQLVVTLRYDDMKSDEPIASTASGPMGSPYELRDPMREVAPEPSAPFQAAAAPLAAQDAHRSEDIEAARAMRSKVSLAASEIMPKVAEFGVRAKTTVGLLLTKAMTRSGADHDAPRRKTSPPPTGALHASGKRVVRDGDDDSEPMVSKGPKLGKKGMMLLGGTAGLLTVVTAMALHRSSTPPPGAAIASDPSPVVSAVAQVADAPVGATAALQANVPLFGPTTLSTTEPVAPAPFASAAAILPGAVAPAPAPVEPVDDQKPESDHDGNSGSSKTAKVASFGHGKISHPTVLRLKTDGEISVMHGARSATGFTVSVPGRRTMETGSSLAGRDSRIASVKVSNGAKGSEISFQFKDGVPPYVVRAKGHDLQIALGRANSNNDDAAETDAPKHGATAKKHSTSEEHHRSKKD